jgi:ataxia telangiectasia mutated family protein
MTARLAYTRSVAVNSIVGYILGIGDRHAHNILVDTLSGEVVHIDFGIVYEQGRGLGTPGKTKEFGISNY